MRSQTVSEPNTYTHSQGDVSPSMPANLSPLVVSHISKTYKGGTQGNIDISLDANPGEILGILGPNGAGKTTLIRQITTEILPTSGEIHILGLDVVHQAMEVKSLLGIMPQDSALFEYLTVHQHLRIFAKLRGVPPREAGRRADELVEDLDLIEHRDVATINLSGGLKRRVLVGIAALSHPPVMVLDEPTTGLDPQSRRSLWSLLRRYKQEGSFVLLTTHSMEEAEALCDRVGIIKDGRLLALDTVDNLRAANGFEFKVTYFRDDSPNIGTTIYGADDRELVAQVNSMGFQRFSVSQTTLEDIYLALAGGLDEFDDRSR
jgi:ABC-2 type transport system ATP-binding protein